MKLSKLFILTAIILAISCSPAKESETETTAEAPSLQGVWEMTDLYQYNENGDTIKVDRQGHRQVKIYTDGYVMWSRTVPKDSTQWYGWGGYAIEDGVLKEWIEYGSHAFMPWIDPLDPFEQNLEFGENTYVQTSYDSAGNPQTSEHYILISQDSEEGDENIDESLEGVWEMTLLTDNGEEVNRTGYRQIKMYYNEYVMWSQQVPSDSIEWFGFGKYSSTGGLLTEWMEFGSHSFMPFIGSEPFIMDLIYGNNTYQQIQADEEGNEGVIEHYKKLGSEEEVVN